MLFFAEQDTPILMRPDAADAAERLRTKALEAGDDHRAIVQAAIARAIRYLQAGEINVRQLNLYVAACSARFTEAGHMEFIAAYVGCVAVLAPDMLPQPGDAMRLENLGLWPW